MIWGLGSLLSATGAQKCQKKQSYILADILMICIFLHLQPIPPAQTPLISSPLSVLTPQYNPPLKTPPYSLSPQPLTLPNFRRWTILRNLSGNWKLSRGEFVWVHYQCFQTVPFLRGLPLALNTLSFDHASQTISFAFILFDMPPFLTYFKIDLEWTSSD